MKKIALGALVATTMTLGASANETFFDYKQEVGIGYEYITSSNDSTESQNALNINGKLMKMVTDEIAVGVALNLSYVPNVDFKTTDADANDKYIGILPTVSYVITPKADVSAILGYTYSERDADFGEYELDGWTYGLGASYEVYPQVRVNIQALWTQYDIEAKSSSWTGTSNQSAYTLGVGYNF